MFIVLSTAFHIDNCLTNWTAFGTEAAVSCGFNVADETTVQPNAKLICKN